MPVRRSLLLSAVGAAVVWSWFASGTRTFTRPAEVLTFIPGLLVLSLTLWFRSSRLPAGRRVPYDARGVALWVGLLIAVMGWEMFQLFSQPRSRHPTISSLLNSLISTHPSRFAGYLLWLLAGGLLVRGRKGRRDRR